MKAVFVSSSGGHWEQLLLIAKGIEANEKKFVCTDKSQKHRVAPHKFYNISDCNQKTPIKLAKCLFESLALLRSERPDIIISTGAAPGLMAIIAAKMLGCKKTIWIDSIANSEKISLSGKIATRIAARTYTQWAHLKSNDIHYSGSTI